MKCEQAVKGVSKIMEYFEMYFRNVRDKRSFWEENDWRTKIIDIKSCGKHKVQIQNWLGLQTLLNEQ